MNEGVLGQVTLIAVIIALFNAVGCSSPCGDDTMQVKGVVLKAPEQDSSSAECLEQPTTSLDSTAIEGVTVTLDDDHYSSETDGDGWYQVQRDFSGRGLTCDKPTFRLNFSHSDYQNFDKEVSPDFCKDGFVVVKLAR